MLKRNLILGAIRGYQFSDLAPFVLSLQQTSFKGDLVLFWNSIDQPTLSQLKDHGATLIPFSYRGGAINSWSRFWPFLKPVMNLPVGDPFRKFVYRRILNLAFVRFLHALDYLESNRSCIGNVLLTDVRDVVFQDDPFRDELPGTIVAYLEAPQMVFGTEPMNDQWILNNYGNETLRALQGHRISCCGTIAGTADGMISYLRAFQHEIQSLQSVEHGADTSVHNVLIRQQLSDTVAIQDNYEGMVGTVGPHFDQARIDDSGLILARSTAPVPVLHQYDRIARLKVFWYDRYQAAEHRSNMNSD